MFSDPGDYIGGGSPQEFDKTNASFSGTVSTGGINLSASGGTSGLSWSFVIDPPPGTSSCASVRRAEGRSRPHLSCHTAVTPLPSSSTRWSGLA